MVKPRLGIVGKALIKVNYRGVPIITQPRKERKIQEHNTDMMETRTARVEQNTRREAEPSTLVSVIPVLCSLSLRSLHGRVIYGTPLTVRLE